jgi:hypothetical protein
VVRILTILVLSSLLVGAALYIMWRQVGQLDAGDSYSGETDRPEAPGGTEPDEQDPAARALDLYHQATSGQQCNPARSLRLARQALEVVPPEATNIIKNIEELIAELEKQVDEPLVAP